MGNGADFTEITIEGRGALVFYWGTETQAEDPALAASGLTHSACRGQCCVDFDDWLLGENRSQVPAIQFDVTCLPSTSNLRSGNIARNGERHPLAVLEESLLHRRFGLGLSPALIDPAAWTTVAGALADEDVSVSRLPLPRRPTASAYRAHASSGGSPAVRRSSRHRAKLAAS